MKKQHMKIMFVLLTPILGFSILTAMPQTTSAVSKSYKTTSINDLRTVSNKQSFYIYSKASASSTKHDKLPKNSAVVVTGKTSNGFSQIRYAFSYAYVKTSALSKSKSPTSSVRYARDISKSYAYSQPNLAGTGYNKNFTATYYKTHHASKALRNFWYYNSAPSPLAYSEYETKNGLYEGFVEDGYLTLILKYPVKSSSKWSSYGKTSEIISTKSTVKTLNGTFKNVVVVKNNGNYNYYAPNKGLIKQQYTYNKKRYTNLLLSK